MFDTINTLLLELREKKPLVLNITNEVTINFIANGLLSLGASPVMSSAVEDAVQLVALASSVVINYGTVHDAWISLSHAVCQEANRLNKPIVFDPVGAGATQYRTNACKQLLEDHSIAILRGNASEILALTSSSKSVTRGVDNTSSTEEAIDAARFLSEKYQTTVVVSGATDYVVQQSRNQAYHRGSELMPKITGTGCLLTAVIASYHAVCADPFLAAQAAVLHYSVCGELTAKNADKPGSFQIAFLDSLSNSLSRENYETF